MILAKEITDFSFRHLGPVKSKKSGLLNFHFRYSLLQRLFLFPVLTKNSGLQDANLCFAICDDVHVVDLIFCGEFLVRRLMSFDQFYAIS